MRVTDTVSIMWVLGDGAWLPADSWLKLIIVIIINVDYSSVSLLVDQIYMFLVIQGYL